MPQRQQLRHVNQNNHVLFENFVSFLVLPTDESAGIYLVLSVFLILWLLYTDYMVIIIDNFLIAVSSSTTVVIVHIYRAWDSLSSARNLPEEKMIVLLDPMQNHINMKELLTDGFRYITDIRTCVQFIRSHKQLEISLFLSTSNLQMMSKELRRHRHVVLYIFGKKQPTQKQKSNLAKGQNRFFFREHQLSEYLRLASIIYYLDRVAAFEESGDSEQADEHRWVTRQQCAALHNELEKKLRTQPSIDVQDLLLRIPFDEEMLQPYIS